MSCDYYVYVIIIIIKTYYTQSLSWPYPALAHNVSPITHYLTSHTHTHWFLSMYPQVEGLCFLTTTTSHGHILFILTPHNTCSHIRISNITNVGTTSTDGKVYETRTGNRDSVRFSGFYIRDISRVLVSFFFFFFEVQTPRWTFHDGKLYRIITTQKYVH